MAVAYEVGVRSSVGVVEAQQGTSVPLTFGVRAELGFGHISAISFRRRAQQI